MGEGETATDSAPALFAVVIYLCEYGVLGKGSMVVCLGKAGGRGGRPNPEVTVATHYHPNEQICAPNLLGGKLEQARKQPYWAGRAGLEWRGAARRGGAALSGEHRAVSVAVVGGSRW